MNEKGSPKKDKKKSKKDKSTTSAGDLSPMSPHDTHSHAGHRHDHKHIDDDAKKKDILMIMIQDEFIHQGLSSMHKLDGIFVQISTE
jgi:hypothetical protein